jgi:hypothetical protein
MVDELREMGIELMVSNWTTSIRGATPTRK